MSAVEQRGAGSVSLSRVFAISALGAAFLGGLLFGVGSLLAIDLGVAAVLEARWIPGYRSLLAWPSLLLSVTAAGFFVYFWYSYYWWRYHHPGGGGGNGFEPSGLLTIMVVVSGGLGLIGLLGLIARYRGGPEPSEPH